MPPGAARNAMPEHRVRAATPRVRAQPQPFRLWFNAVAPAHTPTRPPIRILALGGRVGVWAGAAVSTDPLRAGAFFAMTSSNALPV